MTQPPIPGGVPLRERRTLAEEWADYERLVVPAGAGGMQRRDTKMAFYAGAFSFTRLAYGNLDPNREPTELDVAYLISLEKELHDFNAAIGRAI